MVFPTLTRVTRQCQQRHGCIAPDAPYPAAVKSRRLSTAAAYKRNPQCAAQCEMPMAHCGLQAISWRLERVREYRASAQAVAMPAVNATIDRNCTRVAAEDSSRTKMTARIA